MSFLAIVFLVLAMSLWVLVSPVLAAKTSRQWGSGRFVAMIGVQLLPVLLAALFFQYSESRQRIIFFSYERPSLSEVMAFVVVLQLLTTCAVLKTYPGSTAGRVFFVLLTPFAAAVVTVIASMFVNCLNGNCF